MLETPDTAALAALVLTGGLGWLLTQLGIRGGLLESRRTPHRCAACARILEDGRRCPCRD
ncbi:MAG TPA: hypothetical protein VHK22_08935 [Gaiellaceae bacterium]|jgi:hypothetical protein|nr:hypothetical protein [Gaiellaceae bacterium]